MICLRIKLESPVCSGNGSTAAGIADVDADFDAAGLPFLRGRRLKGVLRDAYQEIFESVSASGAKLWNLPPADFLFGPVNSLGNLSDGALLPGSDLRLGDARPAMADDLSAFFSQHSGGPTVTRDDVIGLFSEVRWQTAMDSNTGAPLKNSLRSVRMLRQGIELYAPIGSIPVELADLLAIAACGVRRIGIGRSRGLGAVRCSLGELKDGRFDDSITVKALKTLESGTVPAPSRPGDGQDASNKSLSDSDSDIRYRLRYSIEMNRSVTFPIGRGDAFTVQTYPFVPGASVRGALVARYRRGGGEIPSPIFDRLFLGSVSFGFAYPAFDVATGEAAVPIPCSVRRKKDAPECVNLAFWNCSSSGYDDATLARCEGFSSRESLDFGWPAPTVKVERELTSHHRNAKDRRLRRAVGVENVRRAGRAENAAKLTEKDPGAFFSYESILPGQVFIGELVGPENELLKLQSLIEDGEEAYFGRSKSAEFGGGGTWRWLTQAPEKLESPSPEAAPAHLLVTLAAPLLGTNEDGHPAPVFPTRTLETRLGLNAGDLTPERSFIRKEQVGGYASHQGLPLAQRPAISAGSVFRFQVSAPLSLDKVADAASSSYGSRAAEGFGRIRIVLLGAPDAAERPTYRVAFEDDEDYGDGESSSSGHGWQEGPAVAGGESRAPRKDRVAPDLSNLDRAVSDQIRSLLLDVFKEKLRRRVSAKAIERAYTSNAPATPHLLHRMLRIVEHGSLNDLVDRLNPLPAAASKDKDRSLRPDAKRALDRVLVDTDRGKKRLSDYLLDLAKDPGEFYRDAVSLGYDETGTLWSSWLGGPSAHPFMDGKVPRSPSAANELTLLHIRELLAALARTGRAKRRSAPKNQDGEVVNGR